MIRKNTYTKSVYKFEHLHTITLRQCTAENLTYKGATSTDTRRIEEQETTLIDLID